jgi:Kef-type K+ transport system membrane component KefB
METHDFFLYLLVILLTARVFAELATRLQAPSVIGELFAGVVLGPSLLGWIEPVEAIKLMADGRNRHYLAAVRGRLGD